MAKVHLICRNGRHLKPQDGPEYESGYWVFSETQIKELLNGTLYLHQKKSEPSYFGGTISGHRLAAPEEPSPGHVVLTVVAREDCKNIAWEGDQHPMAWMGGILP
ncbi:hypothetical protein [Methylovirgula sp. HY1]|uniref:hypothetical protein n=1 Tax=Methylovirgula sp. HY1 TaxID=2822761 RepID=UPI001C5A6987|nr:hypothetical protein [Methylovirgula sp. HY1]QXX73219.1 hypothetical protein MHY1_00013 [Methylovirgula sp. HY1]